jgi:L-lactate dehydrogenase complex protein LldG
MKPVEKDTLIDTVRKSLGRQPGPPLEPRPANLPPRSQLDIQDEIDLFLSEVNQLSGIARRVDSQQLAEAIEELVEAEEIRRATLWSTPLLDKLNLTSHLERLGVEIIPPDEDKHRLATCDLGVTGVDFALAETGTIGLLSSPAKPRHVSLLPRVHLALLHPAAFRPDLAQVFAEAKGQDYLVFITGPSRTADIELTVTLGVHGPKSLNVWVVT